MFRLFTIRNILGYSSRNYLKVISKPSSFKAAAAKTSSDQRFMIIDVNKSDDAAKREQLKYPLIWLRDNCQCSSCFDAQSKSRTIDWTQFDFQNAHPKSISIDKQLEITWLDDHVSKYDVNWLMERSFSDDNREHYLEHQYRPMPKLWSKNQFEMKVFQADDVFTSDEGLYQWLLTLVKYGVVLMKGAPLTEDQCRRLINRIGFIRQTHYGLEYAVRADPNAQNVAYTSNPLQIHTDLPYYDYVPGTTMLHCIAQTKSTGAFNSLVDGFYVAKRLQQENRDAFECLTNTLVNWSDYGEDAGIRFEKINRSPVICLDYEGNVSRIMHSIPQRDTFFSVDVEKVDNWYASLKLFVNLLYEEAFYFKTEPGDILAFSNTRLLHGRTGYEDVEGNIRHLIGAYLDWDEIYSRLRILANDRRKKTA